MKSDLSSHRLAYNAAVNTVTRSGEYVVNDEKGARTKGKKNIRLAQSYLWSETQLTGNSSYVMNVLDNKYNVGSSNLYPMEKRLKQQDVFFTYALGFFILPISPGGGSFQFQLMTFPSAQFFGSGGSNLPSLLGLWTAGSLNVTVNGETLTPAWDLGQHLSIPQTQVPANPIAGSIFYDQLDLSQDGLAVVEPNWIVNGGNDNQYIINYPSNYSSIGLGTLNYHIVLKWYGFLAQNASSIMDNSTMKM